MSPRHGPQPLALLDLRFVWWPQCGVVVQQLTHDGQAMGADSSSRGSPGCTGPEPSSTRSRRSRDSGCISQSPDKGWLKQVIAPHPSPDKRFAVKLPS